MTGLASLVRETDLTLILLRDILSRKKSSVLPVLHCASLISLYSAVVRYKLISQHLGGILAMTSSRCRQQQSILASVLALILTISARKISSVGVHICGRKPRFTVPISAPIHLHLYIYAYQRYLGVVMRMFLSSYNESGIHNCSHAAFVVLGCDVYYVR
jgi:hypothetical protein